MAFIPEHFASVLTEEQLELLAEFADVFEDDDEIEAQATAGTSRNIHAVHHAASSVGRPKLGGKAALNLILAAQKALQKKKYQAPEFQGHRNEWNSELDLEVDDCDKSQTRLPAVPTREHIPVKGTMCA